MANERRLIEEFENPGSVYRGKPFWAWNGRLEEPELRRQLRVMHQMGLGGAFLHARVGLATPYLSKEWFGLIAACVDECKKLGMEAWLYDEDRWPSGAAGGLVTRDRRFRQKRLRLDVLRPGDSLPKGGQLLGLFAARLEADKAYDVRKITRRQAASLGEGVSVLVFRLVEPPCSSWFNGYTYLDTMSPAAVRRFIQVTHEAYRKALGNELGRTVPGIFTDEPNHGSTLCAPNPEQTQAQGDEIPWTPTLPAVFKKRYGYDVLDHLVELFFDVDGRQVSRARYHYHDCKTHMFVDAFARQIGQWCQKNRMMHTGHVLEEPTPSSQTNVVGSTMRFYEHMQAPGIDILTATRGEYDTAKQCASVARQMGRRWVLSELYGCTGWDFSFEGHKAVGDWQAALGVNLRCQHLSWYTMAGEAKRDYPASILHQSPWWPHYRAVEDYFARVGVLLTRGEPIRHVLVIHPLESTWVRCRVGWRSAEDVRRLDRNLASLRDWLLDSQIDFDYADEEMLSRLGRVRHTAQAGPELRVGQAAYRVVLVPPMLTIRSSTLRLLAKFRQAGGEVVFAGKAARYVDAVPDRAATELAGSCTRVAFARRAVVAAVEPLGRTVHVVDAQGRPIAPALYMLRRDGQKQYLFVCNRDRARGFASVQIRIAGAAAEEWDAATGRRYRAEQTRQGEHLVIHTSLPPSGSRLFMIGPEPEAPAPARPRWTEVRRLRLGGAWSYQLDEPNVLVLDRAWYRIGGGEWQGPKEILKIDGAIRDALGLPRRGGAMVQPWARKPARARPVPVALRYEVQIDSLPTGAIHLVAERPDRFMIRVNGRPISPEADEGWWADPALRRIPIDVALLRRGRNEIVATLDFVQEDDLEAMFLLGAFGVRVEAENATIGNLPARLKAGDWVGQGLPFYGAGVVYRRSVPIDLAAGERVFLVLGKWAGTCVRLVSGGEELAVLCWPPYEADITEAVRNGAIDLGIHVIGSRRNCFGPLHQAPPEPAWVGPGNFVTEGNAWQEAYNLRPCGLLAAPWLSVRRPAH